MVTLFQFNSKILAGNGKGLITMYDINQNNLVFNHFAFKGEVQSL